MSHQQVLAFIQQHGPSVPNAVRQGLKLQDNFLAGALLSELVERGSLSISYLVHGTSKFYYDPTHPESLEQVSQYLGEKDIRAFNHLKQEQVVRAADLTPLMRVAIANIKDYSRQLILDTPQGEQEFFRYYLLAQEEAISLIKRKFFGVEEQKTEPSQEKTTPIAKQPEAQKESEEQKSEQKEEVQEKITKKPARTKKKTVKNQLQTAEVTKTAPKFEEGFAKHVQDYFTSKQIVIIEVIEQKKNELSLIVSVPTPVGTAKYYARAKSKKTGSDGDIASAMLEAQHRQLPLLYVCGGTLTKKASELVSKLSGALVVEPWA